MPLDAVHREQGGLFGRISGLLYLLGGASFALSLLLPGAPRAHPGVVLGLSGVAVLCGAVSLWVVDWTRSRVWLMHASVNASLVMIAIAMAATGGARSLAWMYLLFVIVFAACFYRRPVAVSYVTACVIVQALPLLYDGRALHDQFLAEVVIAASSYVALGVAIMAGTAITGRLRTRAELLAAEQGALRRVATAVVDGQSAEQIYALVSLETATLVGASGAGVLRIEGPDSMRVAGSWSREPGGRYEAGRLVPVRPGSDIDEALRTGSPVRVERHPADDDAGRLGYRSTVVCPIRVAGRIWGVLAVATVEGTQLSTEDEQLLGEVGELLATAIASIEDRDKLAAQARTDPLTGLSNHRALHERLTAELARSRRHDGILSVAVLDIDNFKQLNVIGGHVAGDELLVSVAECLQELARAEDTLGRVGGDEFAWILPQTSREAALVAVERVRQLVAARVREPFAMTISAGICDTTVTDEPSELMRLANGALYWSKAHGRNQCWIYDPDVVAELSDQERAERLARSQALLGLRALAHAIDAKDPATRQHSERVSILAGRLARIAGWSHDQALMLSEAALVHDVGKIGVPDATLTKMTPLNAEERAEIRGHAELSARIVEGVLAEKQVEWIRTHHERPDGAGYPRGLAEREIPEGARLLALADAWDVMTVSRPYSLPKTVPEA
ncbi:MAG: diguanylate cyclase, partial [Actinomycetota bacterium]|nr:diguanylate cyclase [Actinomycetota bacterium]